MTKVEIKEKDMKLHKIFILTVALSFAGIWGKTGVQDQIAKMSQSIAKKMEQCNTISMLDVRSKEKCLLELLDLAIKEINTLKESIPNQYQEIKKNIDSIVNEIKKKKVKCESITWWNPIGKVNCYVELQNIIQKKIKEVAQKVAKIK